jgi:branched-chain amino acid transport system substrate-binding protein
MSALIRTVVAMVAIFTLSACSMVQSAMAPAVPTPTFIPVPTRSGMIATVTPEICDLAGEIKLGAVVSLSGPASGYGTSIQRGIDLAVEEINEGNFITPDADLLIVYEDDETNPEQAATAFTRLIEEEEVVGILGPTLSTAAFAADPIAQQAGVPVIATSNTANGITEMGSYIFRSSLPEAFVIPNTLGAVVEATGATSVFMVYDEVDAFTRSGYETMSAAVRQQAIRVAGTETFSTGADDFEAIIEAIEEAEPDLILVSALLAEASGFLTELRAAGIDTPVMGGNGFNSATLAVQAEEAAEGAVSGAAWSLVSPYPENESFVEHYQETYDSDPDQFAAQAYTGVYLYAHALRNSCSTIHSNVRNALSELRLIPTPLGSFSFTSERNPLHPPVVLMFDEGRQVLFE